MDRSFRSLRRHSLGVCIFTAILCLAALAEIGLAGREVGRYYDRREAIEALARGSFMEPPPDYPIAEAYAAYMGQTLALPEDEIVVTGPATGRAALVREPAVIAAIAFVLAAAGFLAAGLAWVWRAHANLVATGLRPNYTPGKALVAYLLPLANLVLTADAMRELHNRSHGENGDFADAPVDDVTAWWTAGIAGLVILSALMGKYLLDAATNLAIVTPLWMEYAMASFAIILLLLCAGLFARLTRVIALAQDAHLADLQPGAQVAQSPKGSTVRLVSYDTAGAGGD